MLRHGNPRAFLAGAALSVAVLVGDARAQDHAQQDAGTSKPAPRAAAGQKDEQAMASLKQMSTILAAANTMSFKTRSLIPIKGPAGNWITLNGSATVKRQGKDKLHLETGGDVFPFMLFYDGKTLTAYAPNEKVYAQQPAPPTIDQMLDQAEKSGEVTIAFADVVSADPYASMTKGLKSAMVVGTSTLGGAEVQHLLVHGTGLDWEIWIGTKDHLPRMLTLTDTTEARKPTHVVEFSDWALDESLPAGTFAFDAPSDATKVPFRSPSQRAQARQGPRPPR
jgi:hypothetical protein